MKRLELNGRGFAKVMFLGGSLIIAGFSLGCGDQQSEIKESTPQTTGSEQAAEKQESNDGSSTREDGSGTR